MRWGSSRVEFVRPVHWVVMLLGDQVVPGTLLGVEAGNLSHGHRFHAPGAIALSHPEHYPALLRQQGWVIVDFAERRERIRQLVEAEAARIGARAEIDPLLLDEVTALVEWPVALLGNFDPLFLDVPMEVLISSMKAHQKYFHLVDRSGRLLPHFITLSNLQSSDPAQVIAGNERVIRPRLADARFFYDNDRKQPLDGWRAPQREIIFHNQLGTLHDKSERLARLAAIIAGTLGDHRVIGIYVPNGQSVDSDKFPYKLRWLAALREWLRAELAAFPRLVLMGDFNIAPEDRDVYDPIGWAGQVLCTPQERAHFSALLDLGLHDAFRLFEQPPKSWSWWDYRMLAFRKNQGLRIDHILVSDALKPRVRACTIDRGPRKNERPSDHAPVVVTIDTIDTVD